MANITAAHANILTDTSDGDLPAAETVPSDVRVFSIPELLEGILSQLSVLDLVIATGVNKTFRNAIKASPSSATPHYTSRLLPSRTSVVSV
jgi:hypothetical protein